MDHVIRGKAFYTNALGNFKDANAMSVAPVQMLTVRPPDMSLVSGERNVPKIKDLMCKPNLYREKLNEIFEKDCFDKACPEMQILSRIMRNEDGILGNNTGSPFKAVYAGLFAIALATNEGTRKFAEELRKETEAVEKKRVIEETDVREKFVALNQKLDVEEDKNTSGIEVNESGMKAVHPEDDIEGSSAVLYGESPISSSEFGQEKDEFSLPPEALGDLPTEEISAMSKEIQDKQGIDAPVSAPELAEDQFVHSDGPVNPIEQETGNSYALRSENDLPPLDEYSKNMRSLGVAAVKGRIDDSHMRSSDAVLEDVEKISNNFSLEEVNFGGDDMPSDEEETAPAEADPVREEHAEEEGEKSGDQREAAADIFGQHEEHPATKAWPDEDASSAGHEDHGSEDEGRTSDAGHNVDGEAANTHGKPAPDSMVENMAGHIPDEDDAFPEQDAPEEPVNEAPEPPARRQVMTDEAPEEHHLPSNGGGNSHVRFSSGDQEDDVFGDDLGAIDPYEGETNEPYGGLSSRHDPVREPEKHHETSSEGEAGASDQKDGDQSSGHEDHSSGDHSAGSESHHDDGDKASDHEGHGSHSGDAVHTDKEGDGGASGGAPPKASDFF